MRPRILFVDDEPLILNSLRRMFRREQVDVQTAVHPRDALAIVNTTGVDVLVSDYRMPDMIGTELLRRVRGTGCNAITILLTGQSDAAVVRRALVDGVVNVVIYKPWRDTRLKDTIMQACRLVSEPTRTSAVDASESPALRDDQRRCEERTPG